MFVMLLSNIRLSNEHLTLSDISDSQADADAALRQYYASPDPHRFASYTSAEIIEERDKRLAEQDHAGAIAVFGAVEAEFMIDARERCQKRKKDKLSKALQVFDKTHDRLSLERHIFAAWKEHGPIPKHIIGELIGAFNYRNWLAHGRYWAATNFGQRYDYRTVYELAETILDELRKLKHP
jgi:hypothetical protein